MCHIKICVNQSLDEMKRNTGFFRSLKNRDIFIDRQLIDSVDIVKVGGLLYSHCKLTNVLEAVNDLNHRINEGYGEDEQDHNVVSHVGAVQSGQLTVVLRIFSSIPADS